MSKEPMELAKNWDETKASKVLPAYAQIKYDGVPLTFTLLAEATLYPVVGADEDTEWPAGTVVALTRQNEVAVSVGHLVAIAKQILHTPGASFTAECFVPGLPFKNSSGIIRRQTPDESTRMLVGIVFDANILNRPKETYFTRIRQIEPLLEGGTFLRVAPYKLVSTVEEVELMWKTLVELTTALGGDLEGMMMHSLTKPFAPGKRCWGMSRYKPQPTIDLEVVSFEEAVSEAGEGLGMVGRVNVRLVREWPSPPPAAKGNEAPWTHVRGNVWNKVVGVGPGKLTHTEREQLWTCAQADPDWLPAGKVFAEIKYMPDESYEALRQPTVQRLRTDKKEGDILEY